jgi:serine protease Do
MDQRYEFIPIDNSADDPVHVISSNLGEPITIPIFDGQTGFDGQTDAERKHQESSRSRVPSRMSGIGRWLWLMTMICVIMSMRFWVPSLVEELQYSVSRGKLRAEHDSAAETLAGSPLEGISHAYRSVSRKISPSLVHIAVETPNNLPDELSFMDSHRMLHKGQGSGVIVDDAGFIMTNYHVVKDASSVEISLADGRTVPANLVGFDELTDLAVLKVDAKKLVSAEWGDSDELDVGSPVWAAGSPFGLQRSVTFGILSAKNRAGVAGTPYQDFLQTDAAVNPGNSGGPLVDTRGRVIGINTAIVGEAYQGISFAVPSSVAHAVYDRIKNGGHVARGWLGVQMLEINGEIADRIGLPDTEGVFVEYIVGSKTSPAGLSGMQKGDVIRDWNGEKIITRATLARMVAKTQVGSEASVTIFRDGQQMVLKLHVAERPADL